MKKGADIKAGAEKGKAETTGCGRRTKAEPKAEPTTTGQASEPKASEPKAKPSTTGQASEPKASEPKSGPAVKSTADDKAPAAKSTTNEKAAPAAGSSAQGTQAPASTSSRRSGSAAGRRVGQPDDRAEEHDPHHGAAVEQRAEGVAEPDQLQHQRRHGGAAQRPTFVTVPETLVEIHPAWRGYSYFIVDDEIIIVEPRTLQDRRGARRSNDSATLLRQSEGRPDRPPFGYMWRHGDARTKSARACSPSAGATKSNSCWRIPAGRSGRARTTAPGPSPKAWCGRTIC